MVSIMIGLVDSWRCVGLEQLLECLPPLGLLLHKCFEVPLLLIVQVDECLVLGLLENGNRLDDPAEVGDRFRDHYI